MTQPTVPEHWRTMYGLYHVNDQSKHVQCTKLMRWQHSAMERGARCAVLGTSCGLHQQQHSLVSGLSVSASTNYPHPRASDPRMVRIRKCTATTSPRIDRVRNCTVITGIQSPARNTHANEQSQSAEFYVTCKVQKSKVTPHRHNLCYVTTKLQNVRKIQLCAVVYVAVQ